VRQAVSACQDVVDLSWAFHSIWSVVVHTTRGVARGGAGGGASAPPRANDDFFCK